MATHTPGPWSLATAGGRLPAILLIKQANGEADCFVSNVVSESGRHVCRLDLGYGHGDDLANARLIAAAPDLLDALRGILEIGKRDTSNPKYDGYFESARAAIKKAEAD